MDLKNYAPLRQFWDDMTAWSVATFGPVASRGPDGPLKHLIKECDEVLAETDPEKRKEEIVDCLFLTFDAANRAGMEYELVESRYGRLEEVLSQTAFDKSKFWLVQLKSQALKALGYDSIFGRSYHIEATILFASRLCMIAFSTPDELLTYCYRKLEKNKTRTWNVPTGNEPVEHVRTPEEKAAKQVETAPDAKSPDKLVSVYQRHITERLTTKTIIVDVYDIAEAYQLSHPLGHAIKKILVAGGRGAKSRIVDLQEAMASIQIEIDFINTHGG